MIVAIYVRVSTDEQAESGNSLSEQKERLSAYCVSMGWSDFTFFVDDGYSAKNLNRPAIKKVIERVERREIDIVLTSKLDRLGRNLKDLLNLVDFFDEHDCRFVSQSETFDTSTAVGRMTLQLLGTFAEFERERTRERVRDNMLSLAKNTDKGLGKTCFGYDLVDGKYVINEDEAQHVRYMFDLAEEGHGHRMIAKLLNDRGALTKQGKLWDQINVKRLMKNEILAGTRIYNKRENKHGKTVMRDKKDWIIKENNHPAIIEPERFERVQDIFNSRSTAGKHANSETYLLTGLVKCKYCERNMKGQTTRNKRPNKVYTYFKYICSSYVQGYGCKHHAIHRELLEGNIKDEIKRITETSPKELKINIAATPTVQDEIKSIKQQLAQIEKRMQKQIEAYTKDLISDEDLKAASMRAENDRNELRIKLEKLENTSGDPEQLQNNARNLLGDIIGEDRMKAKTAIRLLISQIVLGDEEAYITWKI